MVSVDVSSTVVTEQTIAPSPIEVLKTESGSAHVIESVAVDSSIADVPKASDVDASLGTQAPIALNELDRESSSSESVNGDVAVASITSHMLVESDGGDPKDAAAETIVEKETSKALDDEANATPAAAREEPASS